MNVKYRVAFKFHKHVFVKSARKHLYIQYIYIYIYMHVCMRVIFVVCCEKHGNNERQVVRTLLMLK